MTSSCTDKILIVGAGCFGISTAYHLLRRGYENLTVIDRAKTLPALDAASTDINKIVRTSYNDMFYAKLAQEAISSWKDQTLWGDAYHESGVLVLRSKSTGAKDRHYADSAYNNDIAIGARVETQGDVESLRALFPDHIRVGFADGSSGYINRDGGWAHATQGVAAMLAKVIELGGIVIPGKDAGKLLHQDNRTTGVECVDGTIFLADLVIVACGSWTPSAFRELGLEERCRATGQSVAMIQLTQEEGELYRHSPVVIDFASGFYVFPPNHDNVVKLAIHAAGYTDTKHDISTPRTQTSHPNDGLLIPKSEAARLRSHLGEVYPDLAQKPFTTRLCWYNDSKDDDWIISRYRENSSLLLATAGSGHAYKFLPVIGKLVADAVQGTLDSHLVDKFSLDRHYRQHVDRGGPVQELDVRELCTPEDLLAR